MTHLNLAPASPPPQVPAHAWLNGIRALHNLIEDTTVLRCPAEGRTAGNPVTLPYLDGPPELCRRDFTAAATALTALGVTLTPAVRGGDLHYDLDGTIYGIHIRLRAWAVHTCDIEPVPLPRPATAA